MDSEKEPAASTQPIEVIIKGVDIPFRTMMLFSLKHVIASLPALFILTSFFVALWVACMFVVGLLFW